MPLYEYRCKKCGASFDRLRPLSQADRETRCPHCDSQETERQFSTFATGGCGGGGSSNRFR